MRVYHGTTTWKMASILDGDFSKRFMGLFVTDSFERAARYANSQAKQEVTTHAESLFSCAVVATIEVDEPVRWMRRPENHPSLDQCEAIIKAGHIIELHIGEPDRLSYTEHRHVQEAVDKLQVSVHMLAVVGRK